MRFAIEEVPPPSNLYVTLLDKLFVRITSSLTGVSYKVEFRILTPEGLIVPDEEIITPGTAYTSQALAFNLPEGFLLNVTVTPVTTFVPRGATYAEVYLQRASGSAPTYTYKLASGYVLLSCPLSWPGGLIEHAVTRPGNFLVYTVNNPAVGTDWSYTMGANRRQRFVTACATLTTSATVANRFVQYNLFVGANQVGGGAAGANITAGQSIQVIFANGVNQAAQGILGMPTEWWMQGPGTCKFQILTTGLQAADQWSAIAILVEELLEF